MVKDAVDDIFPSGDYKYDAELASEALVELNPKLLELKPPVATPMRAGSCSFHNGLTYPM
jgi:hypothetical protein